MHRIFYGTSIINASVHLGTDQPDPDASTTRTCLSELLQITHDEFHIS